MHISKEVRIGSLATISLLVLIIGFYLLKGANIFSGENNYYVFYTNVQGLQPSSPVQIKGLTIGRVVKIELVDGGKVMVKLAVNKKAELPQGTVAKLSSMDLLGTKAVSLELGTSIQIIQDDDTLGTGLEDGAIEAVSAEVTPLLRDLRHTVNILDTALAGINAVLDARTKTSIQHSVASIEEITANFAAIAKNLSAQTSKVTSIIDNTNSISANLAKNNEHINNILSNTDKVSHQVANAPLKESIEELDKTLKELKSLTQKMNSKDGSVGLLMNDKGLYNNLTSSLKTLDELMADMKAHPRRYINVSVFGRRKD